MIWLALAALSLLALLPMILSLRRRPEERGRRQPALDLHRAQLAELDRERVEGRIAPAEHAAAALEVQRRLLSVASQEDPPASLASRGAVLAAVLLVPSAALGLYLAGGVPDMPAMPLAARLAAARAEEAKHAGEQDALLADLRARIAELDPTSDKAREGLVLLGSVEGGRGHMADAADAWRKALTIRFDPTLAVETAEVITEAEGRPTPESTDLFRRALAEAPADAPWRPMATKRLAEAAPS